MELILDHAGRLRTREGTQFPEDAELDGSATLGGPGTLTAMPRNKRRRNPRMTAVIVVAGATELVTLLNWLSQYSGGRLKEWQLPALTGAILLTGWLAIGQGGAAQNSSYAV
jgi:hypothetical protein